MAMTIETILDEIIRNEGGYVNHPADRGGPTNMGITQATLSAWLRRPATIEDVKNLKEAEAREIYRIRYIIEPRFEPLPDPVRVQIVDIGVNSGPRAAIKIVQKVLNLAGFGPIDVDGVLGPQSTDAIHRANARMGKLFNNAIVDERINFYKRLVAANPSQSVFLNGWMNRANRYRI